MSIIDETNKQNTSAAPTNNKLPPSNGNSKRKKSITIFLILVVLAGVMYYMYSAIFLANNEQTDNAYVNSNIINVTSEVNGTVIAINADNTQFVKEGDVLVKLDPQDAKIALLQAEANLASVVRNLKQQYVNVKQYKALIVQQELAIQKAENDYKRRLPLDSKHIISAEELAHAKNALLSAKAALEVTKQQESTANASIDGVSLVNHPDVLQAKANFMQAWLANQRNTILAPASGYIAQRNVQVGSSITSGTPLLSIVPLNKVWIDANFKEPQLRHIRIDQPVTIVADIYGSKIKYHGRVLGLSAGTGSVFSLLPAQNATGNWIKIVQRVPVKISIDEDDLAKYPLRIGLSTTVVVNTSNQSGSMLASSSSTTSDTTNVIGQPLNDAEAIADKIIKDNANMVSNNSPMVIPSVVIKKAPQKVATPKTKIVKKSVPTKVTPAKKVAATPKKLSASLKKNPTVKKQAASKPKQVNKATKPVIKPVKTNPAKKVVNKTPTHINKPKVIAKPVPKKPIPAENDTLIY